LGGDLGMGPEALQHRLFVAGLHCDVRDDFARIATLAWASPVAVYFPYRRRSGRL
jgi:hypothetical protein